MPRRHQPKTPGNFAEAEQRSAQQIQHAVEQAEHGLEVKKRLTSLSQTDFSRTAAALGEYDRQVPGIEAELMAAETEATVQDTLQRIEALGEAVGVAFGEDTKAFNNPETCRKLVRPGRALPPPGCQENFVRRAVRLWKERSQDQPRDHGPCTQCKHMWTEHGRGASGAEPCKHFGCGCDNYS